MLLKALARIPEMTVSASASISDSKPLPPLSKVPVTVQSPSGKVTLLPTSRPSNAV